MRLTCSRFFRRLGAALAACALPLAALAAEPPATAGVPSPSFDCARVAAHTAAGRICGDAALAELDLRMASTYALAARAVNRDNPHPRTSQRAWLKTRDRCARAGAPEPNTCIARQYRMRIAELRARYGLAAQSGQATLSCGRPPTRVVLRFFQDPTDADSIGVAIAARGLRVTTLYQEPTGSGIRYADAAGHVYEEHQRDAWLTWGRGAPRLACTISG